MSETKHTPEPWNTEYREDINGDWSQDIFDKKGETIATAAWYKVKKDSRTTTTNREANARRIVACVNALEGVETDRLEAANTAGSGFWGKCIHDADVKYSELAIKNKELTAQRDELLAALKEIASSIIPYNDLLDEKDEEHKKNFDCPEEAPGYSFYGSKEVSVLEKYIDAIKMLRKYHA